MATRTRDRSGRGAVLLAVGVLVVGLTGLLGAVFGGPGERVLLHRVVAEIAEDDSARITEVIDYDFAGEDRHGIHRRIGGTGTGTPRDMTATLDGKPVPFTTTDTGVGGVRVRLGDPDGTLTGVHRYRLSYTLPGLVHAGQGFSWDVNGLGWEVPAERVQVRITAPARLESVVCTHYGTGGDGSCEMRQPTRGRLDADVSGLDEGEGVLLRAEVGRALTGGAAGAPPAEPAGRPAAPEHPGPVLAGLGAAAAAAAAALLTAALVRFATRARVEDADGGVRRRDLRRAAAAVKPSPVPPAGLTPAQAGILHAGRVRDEHRAAWLMSASRDGALTITGRKRPVLFRGARPGNGAADPVTAEVLDLLFARRRKIGLGQYHRDFAAAWKLLRTRLDEWRSAGGEGLWTPRGDAYVRAARTVGAVAALTGTVLTAVMDARAGWAAVAGAGLALLVLAGELRVRTARGAQLWLATEALRRHLADPGTPRTDRDTPWAVALGLAATWSAGHRRDGDLVALAAHLPDAAAAAGSRVAPDTGGSSSSSGGHTGGGDGSGGGGGGGSSGGDGGGGGGSW
ncbi:DUF2207 domain-containing protein [Streptomyces sp. NPDC002644]